MQNNVGQQLLLGLGHWRRVTGGYAQGSFAVYSSASDTESFRISFHYQIILAEFTPSPPSLLA